MTVLSRDQITAAGRVSIGEFLQALPEQGNSGANAQVNNGNDGSIYVPLRSLGPQRTLALVNGRRRGESSREAELESELEEIKAALGEAHAELRVWRKKGAIYPASRTSS